MGRRGRAGQGEEPSLSDLPGHDCGLNLFIHHTFGLGKVAQVAVGRLYHGWVLLSIGGQGAQLDQVSYLGSGRGRDGQGAGPILSNLHGLP